MAVSAGAAGAAGAAAAVVAVGAATTGAGSALGVQLDRTIHVMITRVKTIHSLDFMVISSPFEINDLIFERT